MASAILKTLAFGLTIALIVWVDGSSSQTTSKPDPKRTDKFGFGIAIPFGGNPYGAPYGGGQFPGGYGGGYGLPMPFYGGNQFQPGYPGSNYYDRNPFFGGSPYAGGMPFPGGLPYGGSPYGGSPYGGSPYGPGGFPGATYLSGGARPSRGR